MRSSLISLLFLPIGVTAQDLQPSHVAPAKSLRFEVADIRPSPYVFLGEYFHIEPVKGDRFVVHQATPLDLISAAYHTKQEDIKGGAPGLTFDRYEIVAKIPPGASTSDTSVMLQSLLADRYKLVIEPRTEPRPAYLLKVGKGKRKMKLAADPSANANCQFQPLPPNTPGSAAVTLRCSNMTMDEFAQQLGRFGSAYLNYRVVNVTELKGAWDFDLRFSWQPEAPEAITIFDAVDRLGLELEPGTTPRQVIGIKSMAETPTPNVADIKKLLSPLPPPTFEVAVIRPHDNGSNPHMRSNSSDRVAISMTLLNLIGEAWGISTKMVFAAPAFADRQIWDITAKVPTLDTPPSGARAPTDPDQYRLMLRALLEERFGLKVHIENRLVDAYTLLAVSPKLKKADPANRASCTSKPNPGEKNPRTANPLLTMYMHCDNVTVDEFARELQTYSADIIKTPVLNATGIEGRYDIRLSFSGGQTTESPPATESPASDPTGVPISLHGAMKQQLGLKLQLQKRQVAVLVIDHLQEKPTEN